MRVFFNDEEWAFRDEVRNFIRTNLPGELAEKTRQSIHLSRADVARWHHILHERGWSVPHWPSEYGGQDWTPLQRYLFESECAQADAPPLSVFGMYLVGPTIYTFGTADQKSRFLPGIISGRAFWCQGYSETEAGSDLAKVRTTARKVDGGYILNGSKAWTTEGHIADYMICLARTNPGVKPQAGLSLFVVDMKADGVSMQPVMTIDGCHSVNTTFLDSVFLPEDALIGEVDRGWGYAKFLLSHERTNNAQVHRSRREFDRLVDLARRTLDALGSPLLSDPVLGSRFSALEAQLNALEVTILRVLSDQAEQREPGPEASIVKVIGSELQQQISELAMEMLGEQGICLTPFGDDAASQEATGWIERHLYRRVVTIYAGANEIQKNLIARNILGMQS
ncbi:acyl-CoA dehydrogenase family protein [Mesorhizobium sp. NZP2298]|uniref:acyl-CoA dehydrogenase family protein n=1 Tax=Mesorhizobium sp. NZP2298 TaxID=2483403 RepID=UPI0015521E94|nr:acyl-CoA dehydrogenase family protein [Mesorhizobium sp. NZP2298]